MISFNSNEVEEMHLYEIETVTGTRISAFAECYPEAATLFMAWWVINENGELPDFEVKQRNPKWPGLDTGQLVNALERHVSGIGVFDPVSGWTIAPPTDSRGEA